MKTAGVVILIFSAILIGISFYEKYKERVNSLEMYINLLNKYLLKLKMERKAFTDIILNESSNIEYLSECRKNLQYMPLKEAMITDNSHFDSLKLHNDDKVILLNFLANTGKGVYADELALCSSTVDALNKQLESSKNSLKKSGPFSIKIAIAIALWIGIILF